MVCAATLVGEALPLVLVLGGVYRQAVRQAEIDACHLVDIIEERLGSTLRRLHADLDVRYDSQPGRTPIDVSDRDCRYPIQSMARRLTI